MGRDPHARAKRQQKKREKHRQKRATAARRGPSFSHRESAFVEFLVNAAATLLNGAPPMPEAVRLDASRAARQAGGIWHRLIFELEDFMHRDAPWTLAVSDVQPLEASFVRLKEGGAWQRLRLLCLTNSASFLESLLIKPPGPRGKPAREVAALEDNSALQQDDFDRAGQVALNFQRLSLQAVLRDATSTIRKIASDYRKELDGQRHGATQHLKRFSDALKACWQLEKNKGVATDNIRRLETFLADLPNKADSATIAALLVYARDSLAKLSVSTTDTALAWTSYPRVVELVLRLPLPELLEQAESRSQHLKALHYHRRAQPLLKALESALSGMTLDYDARLHYVIARLKLQVALVQQNPATEVRPLFSEFERTFALVEHGVPPGWRPLASKVKPLFKALFVDTFLRLSAPPAGDQILGRLRSEWPSDFGLACCDVVRVLMRKKPLSSIQPLGSEIRAFDGQVFARSLEVVAAFGTKGFEALSDYVFSQLSREEKKACLTALLSFVLARPPEEARRLFALVGPFSKKAEFIFAEVMNGSSLEQPVLALAIAWIIVGQKRQDGGPLPVPSIVRFIHYVAETQEHTPALVNMLQEFLTKPDLYLDAKATTSTRLKDILQAIPDRLFKHTESAFVQLLDMAEQKHRVDDAVWQDFLSLLKERATNAKLRRKLATRLDRKGSLNAKEKARPRGFFDDHFA